MLLTETGYRRPRPREVLRALRAEAGRLVRAGVWPEKSFLIPFHRISETPLITYSGIVPKSEIGLAGLYRGRHRGSKGWYLLTPTWTIADAATSRRLRQKALLHRLAYPGHRLIFLCNTEAETARMRALGEAAVFNNKNCLIDRDVFRPLPGAQKKYDAIYNARLEPFKHHDLTLGIESCAFLFYRAHNDQSLADYEQQLLERHAAQAPGHVFLNPFNFRREPVRLPFDEVNHHLNQAHVGLCLSRAEGAMLASVEYMLAGLPVVSVRSIGGRDHYFDPAYCLIVDDNPQAVAAGVAEMKARGLDPRHVRARTLDRLDKDREALRQLVNRISREEGADFRLPEEWPGVGQPSSLWTTASLALRRAHASGDSRPETDHEPPAPPPAAQDRTVPPKPRPWVGDRPLISILQMGYNQADLIEPSLRAVLAQTYSPLEVVFSDDCSQDGTFEIMERVAAGYSGPHRIVLNRNPRNLGLIGNFNRCVALSSGRLLVQANGDDISHPDRAEKVFQTWATDPDTIKLIFCNMDRIDMDGSRIGAPRSTPLKTLTPEPLEVVAGNSYVAGSSNAYTRDLFEIFGPVPECALVEDHVLLFRAACLGRLAHIDETLVQWRVGGLSWIDEHLRIHPDTLLTGQRIKTIHRMRANHLAFLEDYAKRDFAGREACRETSARKVRDYSFWIDAAASDMVSLIARTPLAVAGSVLDADGYRLDLHNRYLLKSLTYFKLLRQYRAGLKRRGK